MESELSCPHCQGSIAADPALSGQVVTCPHCHGNLQMPQVTSPVVPASVGSGLPQISTGSRGSSYTSSRRPQHQGAAKNPGVAAVLSFFWCGLGQIYNGQIGLGLFFMFIQVVNSLLFFVLIGFLTWPVCWIWSMVDAYNMAERINRRGY